MLEDFIIRNAQIMHDIRKKLKYRRIHRSLKWLFYQSKIIVWSQPVNFHELRVISHKISVLFRKLDALGNLEN